MATTSKVFSNGNFAVSGILDEVNLTYAIGVGGGPAANSFIYLANASLNLLSNGQTWTFETWFNKSSNTTASFLFSDYLTALANPTGADIRLDGNVNNRITLNVYNLTATPALQHITANSVFVPGVWNHMAMTFNGTTVATYINGLSVTGTQTGNLSFVTSNPNITPLIGTHAASNLTTLTVGGPLAIANYSISKGVKYSANFTPSTITTNISSANTQYYLSAYKSLPVSDVGPLNITTTNVNTSLVALSNDVTVSIGTSSKVYSNGNFLIKGLFDEVIPTTVAGASYSDYFTGSNSYISVPYVANGSIDLLNSSQSNWTVETWFNWQGTSNSVHPIISKDVNPGSSTWSDGFFLVIGAFGSGNQPGSSDANTINCFVGNSAGPSYTSLFSNTIIANNVWHHAAVTRTNTTLQLYLDGVLVASNTINLTSIGGGTSPWLIGSTANAIISAQYFVGNISNTRLVNGVAIYNSNFTPVFPLYKVPNTALLTCQSATIIDNSPNQYTINNFNAVSNTTVPGGYTIPIGGLLANSSVNIANRLYPNGNFQVAGIFDEVTYQKGQLVTGASVLVVAGGGGGGSVNGSISTGGGGAGGLISVNSTANLLTGVVYSVIVGSGGAVGANGTNSVFGSYTAIGGGAGSSYDTPVSYQGGSGGGAAGTSLNASMTGGANTLGQGNRGGSWNSLTANRSAAGGGGASANGGDASQTRSFNNTLVGIGGPGGNGVSSSITGTSVIYAAGGGGGTDYTPSGQGNTTTNFQPGAGGSSGVGGQGAGVFGSSGGNSTGNNQSSTAGAINTGSGGGGGGFSNTNTSLPANTGGSGIVVISYPLPQLFSGGNTYIVGANVVHVFTADGTLA